ncbi:hypothetical protein RRR_05815 [Rickettsia rickettsii str. R]|nr:hypothetical protein [Rickettsia endosymbiont of Proechinophthirus fluctus]AJG33815.1 hypothetical protein RRR_05815 [Rickettsia rickettsii str. R]HJD54093.1 hypothetical protein [Rickettsia endosymbiont of Proechinophthirus fluctus]
MTQKPNVLNVGISRAKNNLYIIGSLEIWLKHKYMPEILYLDSTTRIK